MNRRVKLLVGGIGIGVLLLTLIMTSMGSSSEYVTPTEVQTGDYEEELINLEGRATNIEDSGGELRFGVTDGDNTVSVVYNGETPETLREMSVTVAEGYYVDGTLEAQDLVIRAHEGDEHPEDHT